MNFGYSERGGWYGGPLFWMFAGIASLRMVVLVGGIAVIILVVGGVIFGITLVARRVMFRRSHSAAPEAPRGSSPTDARTLRSRKSSAAETSGR